MNQGHGFRFAKLVGAVAFLVCFLTLLPSAVGEKACHARVRANVEVPSGEFSLAELLSPDSCPPLRAAAALVPIGRVPLPGSVRVIAGDDVRALLQKTDADHRFDLASLGIPLRVTVRAAGDRASCQEISSQLLGGARRDPLRDPPHPTADTAIACGAAERINSDAPVRLTRTRWNRASENWEISARCADPRDCVPFLVVLPGDTPANLPALLKLAPDAATVSASRLSPHGEDSGVKPLVVAGSRAMLTWDAEGVRVVVPVFCLDSGGEGQAVRARIIEGGRVVRAVVVSRGMLRIAS